MSCSTSSEAFTGRRRERRPRACARRLAFRPIARTGTRLVRPLLAASVVVVPLLTVGGSRAWAACADSEQLARSDTFSGTAIAELPYDTTQRARQWALQDPSTGAQRTVSILTAPPGSDSDVEDAFTGAMPVVGRSYTVDGWSFGPDEPIFLNACQPNGMRDVTPAEGPLVPDKNLTGRAGPDNQGTDRLPVLISVATVVALAVVLAVGVRSRHRRALARNP